MKIKLLLILFFCLNNLFGYCTTISVDINNITPPNGNWIVLANGSWNGWGWGVELYDPDGDGAFEGTLCDLEDGTYGYVHTITGEFDNWSGWGMVSNAPYNSPCDFVPNDQWYNYGFEVNGQDTVTETNSFGECGIVQSFSPIPSLVKPANGAVLNYIHIPFEWNQYPGAIGYNLEAYASDSFENILNQFISETVFVAKESFEWDETYHWRVQPVLANGSFGEWTDLSTFSTGPQDFDLTAEILTDEDFIYEYTVFGDWNNYRTSIVDIEGKEVWNSGDFGFMMNHVSEYGQLFGFSFIDQPNATGVEVDYDEQPVWKVMRWVDQHEFKQISNGNYMGFVHESQLGPIPIGEWTSYFQQLGYQADGITHEFPFSAQKLVEFDAETKQEIWSWNPHDYYTKEDVDMYGGTWWDAFAGTYLDWTHSNAFFFDQEESAVYISSRHLSRITKIDYPSGNVVWMMGLPSQFMHSGDEHICSDLEFSYQHHIQRLENGNLLFFDNGNLDYIFGNSPMTSRALEVEVIDDSYCNVVWEYVLPANLAAYGMGSVQALENGNYFINTTGGGGTVLEVDSQGNILWEINLGLSWPNGSGYRAYRAPSIHPGAFSVLAENYNTVSLSDSTLDAIELTPSNNYIKFKINNHSGYSQPYDYFIEGDYFSEESSSVFIDAYSSVELIFEALSDIESLSEITFNIEPRFHPNSQKTFYFNISSNDMATPGDVNLNGSVDVIDIIVVISFILEEAQPSDLQFSLADLNTDNQLNILDIVDLVSLILNTN